MRPLVLLVAAAWISSIGGTDEHNEPRQSLRRRISSLAQHSPSIASELKQQSDVDHQSTLKTRTERLVDGSKEELSRKLGRNKGDTSDSGEADATTTAESLEEESSTTSDKSQDTIQVVAELQESDEASDNVPNKRNKAQKRQEPANEESEGDDLATIKEELEDEERMVREVGGYGALLAMVAMIFTAWQMNDNPDGIFATMCRLVITICGLVIGLLLAPCRRCIGPARASHTYGHVPVAPSNLEFGFT